VGDTLISRARGLFGRSVADEPKADAAKPVRKSTAFHAVSIMPGPRCCAMARDLRGQRFVSREAPVLPLAGCDRPDCTCRYEHYDDRRAKSRRARDMGVSVDGWVEEERRGDDQPRGRRKTDR
jgi:hypothetical protein